MPAGKPAGGQYDQLNGTGTIDLDGQIDVRLIGNFVPEVGDRYTIITATGGVSGAFTQESLADLPPGRAWQIDQDPDAVVLTVVAVTEVAAPHVFYNNTDLDGNNPAANADDDAAIDATRTARLAGDPLVATQVTGNTQGLNGVMLDVVNFDDPVGLVPADFEIRVGTGGDPATWALGLAPSVAVRPGAGTGGTDRVTLTWPDGTFTDTWVQVTVTPDNTGLATPDVYYFANRVGDANGDLRVNATDLAHVLAGWGSGLTPGQGNFDLSGTTGVDDLATLFTGGGVPLADFTAPPVIAPPDAAKAVDAVIVQAISGPQPETDPIVGPIEYPLATTPLRTNRTLLRRLRRSLPDDDGQTDRQRLTRQQAVDRVHEQESIEASTSDRLRRRSRVHF